MSTTELRTARGKLLLLRPQHANLLLSYRTRNQAHLSPWEPRPTSATTSLEQDCKQAAQRAWLSYLDGHSVQFIAVDHAHSTMLGACNFTQVTRGPLQACYLGYSVDQAHQCQGLMREFLQAGIAHMFHTVGLHRIMANHMPSNLRSERLLRALDFEVEGYARAYLRIAGRWEDMVLNALVHPDAKPSAGPV